MRTLLGGLGPFTAGAGFNPWLENKDPDAKKKKKRPFFFPGNPEGGKKRKTSQQEAVNLHEKIRCLIHCLSSKTGEWCQPQREAEKLRSF